MTRKVAFELIEKKVGVKSKTLKLARWLSGQSQIPSRTKISMNAEKIIYGYALS
ncbi:MAG: hypothetical protein K2Q09_00020 [Phycisphaerales bacterium]|nr:hypothetical protein [Phycisphaerales bacterium]